jgi:hypothetical protein
MSPPSFEFSPYIHVVGEVSVPRGITLFGISGGHERWTTIRIPESILRLPLAGQLERFPELMSAYLKQYGGQCPFFGAVKGFRYVREFDYFEFDSGGILIGRVHKDFRRGVVSLSLVPDW